MIRLIRIRPRIVRPVARRAPVGVRSGSVVLERRDRPVRLVDRQRIAAQPMRAPRHVPELVVPGAMITPRPRLHRGTLIVPAGHRDGAVIDHIGGGIVLPFARPRRRGREQHRGKTQRSFPHVMLHRLQLRIEPPSMAKVPRVPEAGLTIRKRGGALPTENVVRLDLPSLGSSGFEVCRRRHPPFRHTGRRRRPGVHSSSAAAPTLPRRLHRAILRLIRSGGRPLPRLSSRRRRALARGGTSSSSCRRWR